MRHFSLLESGFEDKDGGLPRDSALCNIILVNSNFSHAVQHLPSSESRVITGGCIARCRRYALHSYLTDRFIGRRSSQVESRGRNLRERGRDFFFLENLRIPTGRWSYKGEHLPWTLRICGASVLITSLCAETLFTRSSRCLHLRHPTFSRCAILPLPDPDVLGLSHLPSTSFRSRSWEWRQSASMTQCAQRDPMIPTALPSGGSTSPGASRGGVP